MSLVALTLHEVKSTRWLPLDENRDRYQPRVLQVNFKTGAPLEIALFPERPPAPNVESENDHPQSAA